MNKRVAEPKSTEELENPASGLRNWSSWTRPRGRGLGMWAWLIHRVTGLLLILFLFGHIYIFLYSTRVLGAPLLEGQLLFAYYGGMMAVGLFHAVNGVRNILLDLGIGSKISKGIFGSLLLVTIIVFVYGAYILWAVLVGL